MEKKPKTPKRVKPKRSEFIPLTEDVINTVLLRDVSIDAKIEEASKPMYLARYE